MAKRIYVVTIIIICLTGTFLTAQAAVRMGRRWMLNAPFGGTEINKKYGDYSKQNDFLAKYEYVSSNIEKMFRDVTTTYVLCAGEIKTLMDMYKSRIIHTDSVEIVLYEGEAADNVTSAAEAVIDLSDWLSGIGVRLVYTQLPSRLRYDLKYADISENISETQIKKANEIVKILNENGVGVCDLSKSEELIRNMTFDESNHWSSEDALAATYIIDDYFEKNGIISQEDLERFHGISFVNALDDKEVLYEYYLPVPSPEFEYEGYEVIVNEKDTYTGDFVKAVLKDQTLWDDDNGAYHDLWRQKNGDTLNIRNSNAIRHERLLVLGDSFSWPITAYMSLMYDNVDYINPQSYPGLVRGYIEINEPDVVLIAFSDVQAYDDENGKLFEIYEGLR